MKTFWKVLALACILGVLAPQAMTAQSQGLPERVKTLETKVAQLEKSVAQLKEKLAKSAQVQMGSKRLVICNGVCTTNDPDRIPTDGTRTWKVATLDRSGGDCAPSGANFACNGDQRCSQGSGPSWPLNVKWDLDQAGQTYTAWLIIGPSPGHDETLGMFLYAHCNRERPGALKVLGKPEPKM